MTKPKEGVEKLLKEEVRKARLEHEMSKLEGYDPKVRHQQDGPAWHRHTSKRLLPTPALSPNRCRPCSSVLLTPLPPLLSSHSLGSTHALKSHVCGRLGAGGGEGPQDFD